MVVLHFTNQAQLERNPLSVAAFTSPSAGPSRSFAGEALSAHEGLEDGFQLLALCLGEARTETDVVQLSVAVVEAQQERTHLTAFLRPAKSADYAIGRAHALDLHHAGTLT